MKYKRFSKEILSIAHKYYYDHSRRDRETVSGYTIDGEKSRDLDDGINLRKFKEGYLVQVSIADVSDAVKPGSALFNETMDRVETKYLPKLNLPMLPKVLSENRLSLMPGYITPSVTFDIFLNENLDVDDFNIRLTAFENINKLTYEKFDKTIKEDSYNPDNLLFRELAALADNLVKKRRQKGALAFYDLKKRVYANEEGIVLHLDKSKAHISHIVIQELMILTNMCFSKFCMEKDIPILFRNHEPSRSVPDRDEIFRQLEFALSHSNYLDSFMNRSSLWFNRAEYSPVLKGHFALNEAAYTHVTSPIRRVADLINHQQIKAYLFNKEFPYSHDDLAEMSEHINKKIAEQKDKVKEHHKEIADEKAQNNLGSLSAEQLLELEPRDFLRVVVNSVREDVLPDNLKDALISGINKDIFRINIYHAILFENDEETKNWTVMKERALKKLAAKRGFPVQLLNLLSQTREIHKLGMEVVPYGELYKAHIHAYIAEDRIESTEKAVAYNKKEALHIAAAEILLQLPGVPDGEVYEIIPGLKYKAGTLDDLKKHFEQGITYKDKQDPNNPLTFNFVGRLLQFSQQNILDGDPEFSFTESGMDHDPEYTCYAKAYIKKEEFSAAASANNKKQAKQLASKKLFEMLQSKGLLKKPENKKRDNPSQNPVNTLLEIFQKKGLDLPEFEISVVEENGNQNIFSCTVSFEWEKNKMSFSAEGPNKKEARKNASEKALKRIE